MVESYPAIVTRIENTRQRGEIFVRCSEIMGDEETEYPSPIQPVFDWGFFFIPDVNEEVEIEVVVQDAQMEGVPLQAFVESENVRWRGKRFESRDAAGARPVNDAFKGTNYGKRRGFATPSGHVFMFDDTSGSEQINLELSTGGSVNISANGEINISADKINLNSGDSADVPLVRGTELKSFLDAIMLWATTHTHPVTIVPPLALPSVVPPFPISPPTLLSTDGKVK